MAYTVKPAVVRVHAFSTGTFQFDEDAILEIDDQLRESGFEGSARSGRPGERSVATGAGGSGSGFIVHPDGFILTSAHVVNASKDSAQLLRNGAIAALRNHFPARTLQELEASDQLERAIAFIASSGKVTSLVESRVVELSNGEKFSFRVLRTSRSIHESGNDLALLRISRTRLPTLPIADSNPVQLQDPVWIVGYPAVASSTPEGFGKWLASESDLESTITAGAITAIRKDARGKTLFQTDAAMFRGNSGGPVVNAQGHVIGLVVLGNAISQKVGLLLPAAEASAFLAQAAVPADVTGPFNSVYEKALDAAWDGRWMEARERLREASVLFPNSPDLIRFTRDAEAGVAALPFWRAYPYLAAACSLGALLLLAAVVSIVRHGTQTFPKAVVPESIEAGAGMLRVAPLQAASNLLGKLTVLNGGLAGERFGLGGSGIRIGRESALCEIVLDNPKVSRLHAQVVSVEGRVMLVDQDSANGTFVNDRRIKSEFLNDGDIIHFGGRNAIAVAFHL